MNVYLQMTEFLSLSFLVTSIGIYPLSYFRHYFFSCMYSGGKSQSTRNKKKNWDPYFVLLINKNRSILLFIFIGKKKKVGLSYVARVIILLKDNDLILTWIRETVYMQTGAYKL